jgi:hypothetical protein
MRLALVPGERLVDKVPADSNLVIVLWKGQVAVMDSTQRPKKRRVEESAYSEWSIDE